MGDRKPFVLLCEDMDRFSKAFEEAQGKYFDVKVCPDVHKILDRLNYLKKTGRTPDLVLLDLFSKKDEVEHNDNFIKNREEVDSEVETIREMLDDDSMNARKILAPHGIYYLKCIRETFPYYELPIILYSRLGPYILNPDESAAVDDGNAEFLFKWMPQEEQRKKIKRFLNKWRSQDRLLDLEISRKLSTLPDDLALAVADDLRAGKFRDVVLHGFGVLQRYLQDKTGSVAEGKYLH